MSGQSAPPPTPPGGSMMFMLLFMIVMTFMLMSGDIRNSMGTYADPFLSSWLPSDKWFVLTVLIIGSVSMFVNTVLRNLFMDPIAQAHIGHRQRQVRQMMNEARVGRDPILMEKAQTLQQHMMPEQMKVQMGAMKPMMFTMFFIIAIFAWMGTTVETFRVDYVSLPWSPDWNLTTDKFLFFPAWIAAYICMSAPLGRIVDRHIKLVRYKSHPIVVEGEHLKEPLLHLVSAPKGAKSAQANSRQRRSEKRRSGPRKTASVEKPAEKSTSVALTGDCPQCGGTMIERDGPNTKVCKICRHEWR
ncbi:MAG: DUF106 domain-containing protein [Euryarchaeota archaeon]|jgi:uncharacterized membrane protein (DUF106 family)|nr:DUF106 domain-containing protein [Euryarchaeota archaeon]MBT5184614.1 DUF106 domain-containing protein [Euryarchaeota archaeon]